MIYTVTLNPSIDYVMYHHDDIQPGRINRSTHESSMPGGKGISVSRALDALGVDNIALGFIGGLSGRFIENFLNTEGTTTDFIKIPGANRINVKIMGDVETGYNAAGPTISLEDENKMTNKIQQMTPSDILVLSGSKIPGISDDFYIKTAKYADTNNIPFVLDTSGKDLLEAVKYNPLLVKPNEDELGKIFDTTIKSVEEALHYGKKLYELGAQNVIVSLGANGAVLINDQGEFKGEAPQGEVVSTVGAGDSMVAGYLAEVEKGRGPVDAFAKGLETGSASAFVENIASRELIDSLSGQAEVYKL